MFLLLCFAIRFLFFLEEVPAGQIPRTIEVYLEGDIVDLAYTGNHVTVTGILKEKRVSSQDELTFSSFIHAINLEVIEKGFEEEELTQEDIEAIEKLKSSYRNIGDAIVDSDIIEGKWMLYGYPRKLPLIPGHEIIGRVEKNRFKG